MAGGSSTPSSSAGGCGGRGNAGRPSINAACSSSATSSSTSGSSKPSGCKCAGGGNAGALGLRDGGTNFGAGGDAGALGGGGGDAGALGNNFGGGGDAGGLGNNFGGGRDAGGLGTNFGGGGAAGALGNNFGGGGGGGSGGDASTGSWQRCGRALGGVLGAAANMEGDLGDMRGALDLAGGAFVAGCIHETECEAGALEVTFGGTASSSGSAAMNVDCAAKAMNSSNADGMALPKAAVAHHPPAQKKDRLSKQQRIVDIGIHSDCVARDTT